MNHTPRMKESLILGIALILVLALALPTLAAGPAEISLKNTSSPIIYSPVDLATRFLPGDWDGRAVNKPSVIKHSGTYMMWYDGVDFWDITHVGLATSTDGVNWTKPVGNPVLSGDEGAWDAGGEHGPFVMYQDGLYKMWYEGSNGTVRQLGYATSPNGTSWLKEAANPVLEAKPGSYDQDAAGHGTVLFENPTYKLWYHAIGTDGIIIAYATSPDGVNWTKVGPNLLPAAGMWDSDALWGPSVLKVNDTYWMWYAGYSNATTLASIGAATSPDGVNWTRVGSNPVVTLPGENIGDPTVILDGETFKMWFSNYADGKIYYTTSNNGTTWGAPVAVLDHGLLHPLDGFHDGPDGVQRSTGCSAFGWVVDPDDANRDVTIQVLVDGVLVKETLANQYREGIDPAACPQGLCGYAVDLWGLVTPGVEHSVQVQGFDEESQDWWGLEGTPKTLTCWGYPEGVHDGVTGDRSRDDCFAVGWTTDPDVAARDVQVRVMVNATQVAAGIAGDFREDLESTCLNGTCGFTIDLWYSLPLNQPHEVTVQAYDLESTSWMDLDGTPLTLTCQGGIVFIPLVGYNP